MGKYHTAVAGLCLTYEFGCAVNKSPLSILFGVGAMWAAANAVKKREWTRGKRSQTPEA